MLVVKNRFEMCVFWGPLAGTGAGIEPPPLPPMRRQEPGLDPMMEDPEYGGIGDDIEGEYMTLLRKGE